MPNDQTVLITGASSGIGADLAKLFARDSYRLVLVARGEHALERLAGSFKRQYATEVKVLPKDLALPQSAREIYQQLRDESIDVEILVNNAGFGAFGYFWEIEESALLEMIDVNIRALTELTRLFLPRMIEKKYGKILNVASTAAFQPGPLMSVYYASKAYVLWLSEALSNEVRGTGVTVTALCPGPTRTEFQKRAGMEDSGLISGKLLSVMSSEKVARIGYDGLMKNKTIVIPGFLNKAVAFSVRLTPRSLVAQIARKLQERRDKSQRREDTK